jgi:hypothetical protein
MGALGKVWERKKEGQPARAVPFLPVPVLAQAKTPSQSVLR